MKTNRLDSVRLFAVLLNMLLRMNVMRDLSSGSC